MDFENRRDKLINSESGKKFFDGEMQECINDYAEFILSKLNEAKKTCPDAFAELEVRVDFSRWVPNKMANAQITTGKVRLAMPMNISEEFNAVNLKNGKPDKIKENTQVQIYRRAELILDDY